MDPFHYLFKYIIVGDTSVGKSCLLLSYTDRKFKEEHDTTIGVEFGSQTFKYKNKVIKIQIWDTVHSNAILKAGQESFRSITRSYYKGSIGVILQFDITNRQSFNNIVKWQNEVLNCAHENVEIVLVGNKSDLEASRQVSTEEAQLYATQNRFEYIETSAKTGNNVDSVFQNMGIRIMDRIESSQIDFTNDNVGIKLGTFYQKQEIEDGPKKEEKSGCC